VLLDLVCWIFSPYFAEIMQYIVCRKTVVFNLGVAALAQTSKSHSYAAPAFAVLVCAICVIIIDFFLKDRNIAVGVTNDIARMVNALQ